MFGSSLSRVRDIVKFINFVSPSLIYSIRESVHGLNNSIHLDPH
jgi:hypothetical protein